MFSFQCLNPVARRLALISVSRINAPQGCNVYRINEVVLTVKERRKATALQYASSSLPWKSLGGSGKSKDDACDRGRMMPCGFTPHVGWLDAAYGGPVDGGGAPIGLCDRLSVMGAERPAPCPAMDVRFHPEASYN